LRVKQIVEKYLLSTLRATGVDYSESYAHSGATRECTLMPKAYALPSDETLSFCGVQVRDYISATEGALWSEVDVTMECALTVSPTPDCVSVAEGTPMK
jgi:hypothetical protein